MKEIRLPAIPPNDYEGSMADWVVGLIEMGYPEEKAWEYYDIELTESNYTELLEKCEA